MKDVTSEITILSLNKKARHDYEILDTYEAGMVLTGPEVKSIREGTMNLKQSYVRMINREVFLVGCHIGAYSFSRQEEYNPLRERKLLLHRREIERVVGQAHQKGLTLVPIKAYLLKGRIKLEFGLARGKKMHDKRQDTKKREADRDMERAINRINRS